jgi:hypothetical protein
MHALQVSIPSQRRYVGYWAEALSFPKRVYDSHRGDGHTPPEVILPQSRIRELRRIRLYDMVNTESVFFVVSELQEVSTGHSQTDFQAHQLFYLLMVFCPYADLSL